MHRHAHTVLALAPLVLLAACGGSSDTATPADEATTAAPITSETGPVAAAAAPVAYDCLPAHLLTVAYDNSGSTPQATLTLDGTTHVLTSVTSASGAKYATDSGRTAGKTLVWWTKGPDGMLLEGTVGGTEADETQIAECSPSAG